MNFTQLLNGDGPMEKLKELIERIEQNIEVVKALEERVTNIEEVLSKGVDQKIVVPVEGETPEKRFENFLVKEWRHHEFVAWQDLCDAYTLYATIRRHRGLSVDGWLKRRFEMIVRQVTGADLPNYIPVGFSARLIQLVRLQPSVFNVIPSVDLPTEVFKPPVAPTGFIFDYVPAGGTVPMFNPSASELTLTARKIATGVTVADEVTEDAIVAILPTFQAELAFAAAEALDNAALNGDTSASSGVIRVWDGLLKKGYPVDITTFNAQSIQNAVAQMGKYGVNPSDVVVVVSPEKYALMVGWDEVATVDKYGSQATVLTGELGKIYGKAILVSPHLPSDVHAVLFNRRMWLAGIRRQLRIEVQRDITKLSDILVASMRVALVDLPTDGHHTVKLV